MASSPLEPYATASTQRTVTCHLMRHRSDLAILYLPCPPATISRMEQSQEPVIYRAEVLAIIGALSDLVVDVRAIRDRLEEDDGEEEEDEEADS